MTIPIVQVDAFTSEPFAGNPAAVCVLSEDRDAVWMQRVAREMNLAETAFLRARVDHGDEAGRPDRPGSFDLRWFTPVVEVDLCGHATLASAHVLWESGRLGAGETARFHTRSGVLTAVQRGDWIELDFPATPDEPVDAPPALLEALGVSPRYVGRSRFDYVVELDGEEAVRALRPDFPRLSVIEARGIIATSRSLTPDVDFVSRYFAPAFGINEDPATGSAHCCLAPFWSRRLGQHTFLAHQVSERGGVLKVTLEGDRVRLGGQAVTVLRGELTAAASRPGARGPSPRTATTQTR
jgi:PhzF family phenazine biosynthesis protein